MEQLILKQEIVDAIKKDTILFGKVAAALGLSIRTMSDLLPANPPRLATASVLKVLREHLNVSEDSELLTEMQTA
jgi:hypothetical protein